MRQQVAADHKSKFHIEHGQVCNAMIPYKSFWHADSIYIPSFVGEISVLDTFFGFSSPFEISEKMLKKKSDFLMNWIILLINRLEYSIKYSAWNIILCTSLHLNGKYVSGWCIFLFYPMIETDFHDSIIRLG